MRNKLLKRLIASVCIVIYCISTLGITSIAADTTNNYTNEQMALREVANAYYNKGIKAQYCSVRKSFTYSPEEATSQHTIYSVCSDYIFCTYYQAFGIRLPFLTNSIIAYAQKYYDSNNITTNDVIEYWQVKRDENGEIVYDEDGNKIYEDNKGNVKDINLSTSNGRLTYGTKLLTEYNLQVGDIICYFPDGSEGNTIGHTLLVYDIIYDESGEPVDALIRESTSKYETETTKITKGLSYAELLNENYDIYEGTFQEKYLKNAYTCSSTRKRNSTMYSAREKSYFAVLRPLLRDENENYTGKYYYATFKSADTPTGYECTGRTLTDYEMTTSAEKRIQYSAIDIEKTVDVFNNSVVNLGDTLEYTIKVKNNSNSEYNSFEIIENISDYTEIVDYGNGILKDNTLVWNIQGLKANAGIEIKYKVKVKDAISALGKDLVSTGTVAGIASSTIKNTISSNLKVEHKSNISSKMQTMIASKSYLGQELISKLYNETFGVNLNLENFVISDLVKAKSGTQYYSENSSNVPAIYLNKENSFSKMLLSNYFGALNTTSAGKVQLKYWENSRATLEGRSERADTIYKENFQTGDILIYQNVQEANSNVTYKTENGTYYLMYISEEDKITIDEQEVYGFIGINENNEINQISIDYTSLQTLLGKDYYVILRPSMVSDIVPMELDIEYSTTKNTNKDVDVIIRSNEEMIEVEGWSLSTDKKMLTKTYTANKTENIAIYDLAGNKTTTTVSINNIDKVAPLVEVLYSEMSTTDKDVTVTIKADEIIKDIEGWTLSTDKKQLTKIFTKNSEEIVIVKDQVENSVTATIKVSNINKTEKDNTLKDDTISNTELPDAGKREIVLAIVVLLVLCIIIHIKLTKYKNIE